MTKRWFTSDLHFYHKNVIKYCDRPYENVDVMNHEIIKNWNSVVNEEDDVYVVGDVAMMGNDKWSQLASPMKKLKGKIHLIYGNHDRLSPKNYVDKCNFFSVHYPYLELDNGWILLHDPAMAVACPSDAIVIAGHVHDMRPLVQSIKGDRIVFNVGVDVNDFTPVSEETIKENILRIKKCQ